MLSLLVNLRDGRTLKYSFDDWKQWAKHVESRDARGFALQNGASSSRVKPPVRFRRVTSQVTPLMKGDAVNGVEVRYFADVVVFAVTLYRSGVVVSNVEKLGRRIGP